MKTTGAFFAGLLLILTSTVHATQTAQGRMYCWSLRFNGASAVDEVTGFYEWTLNVSRFSTYINNELGPGVLTGSYTHSGRSFLYSDWTGVTTVGTLRLNVPNAGDANGNGFDDFFEVSQPVPGLASSGVYGASTPISATWSRDASNHVGTCLILLPDPYFPGEYLYFYHTFELIEYAGTISYTPGTNAVSANLDLTQTGNAANTLQGAVQLTKAVGNPSNQLTLQTAFLTNASAQTLGLYSPTTIFRDLSLGTNYYGPVEFNDGDFSTPEDDFYSWELSIDDLNDTDHDGIPDFSDTPSGVTPPRRPTLSLASSATNLWLTVSGDVNRLHHILGSTNLTSGWTTNISVTLTNDPQMISLPLPDVPTRFWRAIVQ
jgi:hypothetical protein